MMNGGYYFVRDTTQTTSKPETVAAETAWRTSGYNFFSYKQMTGRVYQCKTGNNFAAFPGWLVTPGARPILTWIAPWYYSSAILAYPTVPPAVKTDIDQGPHFRERMHSVTIVYKDTGVATAELQTISNSPAIVSSPFLMNVPYQPGLNYPGGIYPFANR